MMPRPAPVPALVPLLIWQDVHALEEMERERRDLISRMQTLPRCSHRRIVLAARLRELTHRIISAQVDLRGRRS